VSASVGKKGSILARLDVTLGELTEVVDENPSLRGMLIGYLAEKKLRTMWFSGPEITDAVKHDDHDRRRKGDLVITYKGKPLIIEVKSLQTSMIRREGDRWVGKAQCDASDRRPVTLDDGSRVETTCLLAGEFDILAVNLFAFENTWRYVFAKNEDLPRSGYRGYTPKQQKQLLATLVRVSWPPEPPFYDEPFRLLDEVVRGRARRSGERKKTKK